MADDSDHPKEFDNSGDRPLCVPGFGCPFNFQLDSGARFTHGIDDTETPRATAREIAMLQVMDQLTDKPDWRRKVFDTAIVAKWKEEAKSMELISDKAFEWCITELRDKATEGNSRFTITLDVGTRCVKADGLVGEQLHHDLRAAIQPLLDAPVKDWHPGSDEQVLNLVHPSLYPLVYGETRVIESGQVKLDNILEPRDDTFIAPIPISEDGQSSLGWSTQYQWLPCDVTFTGQEGLEVKITSYINNLPYKSHEKLYVCVEKLISTSIPLWNEVLGKNDEYGISDRTPLRILTREAEELDEDDKKWIASLPYVGADVSQKEFDEAIEEVKKYLQKPDRPENLRIPGTTSEQMPPDWETDDNWGPRYTAKRKFDRIRRVVHPEPFFGCTYEDWKQGKDMPWVSVSNRNNPNDMSYTYQPQGYEVSIENTFRQQGLQVIVKVASIELTPEKPAYKGGNWHLEGMLNEHIAATAIYYFDVHNVTESRIRYRQRAVMDLSDYMYAQDDFVPLEIVFGVDDLRNDKPIQEVGSIATTQGRLLAFPNTRQHRVDPFELADKTKPGHRRFIVLWLIDPHYRVLSTKNVPPQQFDWWKQKMAETFPTSQQVPGEVLNMIDEELKRDTMTREQAEEYRLGLMEERTTTTDEIHYRIREYQFCEH